MATKVKKKINKLLSLTAICADDWRARRRRPSLKMSRFVEQQSLPRDSSRAARMSDKLINE